MDKKSQSRLRLTEFKQKFYQSKYAHLWFDGRKFNTAIYNWENLRNIAPPGALEYAFYLNSYHRLNGDLDMAHAAADC